MVSRILFVCLLCAVVAVHQELGYMAGVKLCKHRCAITGSCINISLDLRTLHCQLIIVDNKQRTNSNLVQLHSAQVNFGLPEECRLKQRLLMRKTNRPKCVTVLQEVTSRPEMRSAVSGSTCISGSCQCPVGWSFDRKLERCAKVCKRYGPNMTLFKDIGINKHNDKMYKKLNLTQCQTKCIGLEDFVCKAFDFGKFINLDVYPTTCLLSNMSYFEVSPDERVESLGWIMGVRNCEA